MEISKIAIGKENPKIPLTGSSVKRKRLSDITNTVSSSFSNAQFQDKSKEVSCIVTKDCIQQIMEENARLLKTLGERDKIVEFTSIELQRLRIMLEKANQQNRSLAQANSQMQSELTLSKERLKAFQHELGCTVAVLRSKKSELDEKNNLNKELIEKIRIQSERSKLVEITIEGRQVGNSMACRLYRDSQLDGEKLNNGHCEETKAKASEDYNRAEVATGISLLHPVSNSRDCIPKRKTTRRSKALGSTTLTDIAKEKPNNESRETVRCEAEHSKCAEAATDASRSHPADDNMVCEPNGKRNTRSQSLGAAATVTHQVEVKEKDTRKRSSRRISNILTTEASEYKDYVPEVVDAEIPACSAISEPLNKVEVKEKDDTRTWKSLRSKSNTLKSEACESKDYLLGIVDAEIPVCSVMSEPTNQVEANEKVDTRTQKSFRSRSNTLNSEACESKDYLLEIVDAEISACSVMSEPPNQVEAKQQDDTRTRKSLRSRFEAEAGESEDRLLEVVGAEIPACSVISEPPDEVEAKQEDDKRTQKSLRRSSNTLKSGARESKYHLPASADMNKPTFSTIIEPPNEEKIDNLMEGEEGNAQKDQIPACSVISEPPDEVEAKQEDDKRSQKSLRRSSNTLKSGARESKYHLPASADMNKPTFSTIIEPPNEEKIDNLMEGEEGNAQKDQIPACSVISEPPDEVEAKQEDDKRTQKSLRRSSNTLKSGVRESKYHLPASADMNKPTFSTIIEPPNEEKINNLMEGEEGNAQKDQIAITASEDQGQEVRRTSGGRPMRQAAGKISSYREIAINVKMRRPASLPH